MATPFVNWSQALQIVRPHIVRILCPDCQGTGFIVSSPENGGAWGIATAEHVIRKAHRLKQIIEIEHVTSGRRLLLRPIHRTVRLDRPRDTAVILFDHRLPFPEEPLALAPKGRLLKVGHDVGWVGFPEIVPERLCFFTGRIAATDREKSAYYIDGVAINGVSGGPVFWNGDNKITLIGLISAYQPTRRRDGTPGVAIVKSVEQFHQIPAIVKSKAHIKRRAAAEAAKRRRIDEIGELEFFGIHSDDEDLVF